jgi:hypothetical protein
MVNQIDHRNTRLVRVGDDTHAKLKQISGLEGLPIRYILDLLIETSDMEQIRKFGDYIAEKYLGKGKEI